MQACCVHAFSVAVSFRAGQGLQQFMHEALVPRAIKLQDKTSCMHGHRAWAHKTDAEQKRVTIPPPGQSDFQPSCRRVQQFCLDLLQVFFAISRSAGGDQHIPSSFEIVAKSFLGYLDQGPVAPDLQQFAPTLYRGT